jgi:hypothetical protein
MVGFHSDDADSMFDAGIEKSYPLLMPMVLIEIDREHENIDQTGFHGHSGYFDVVIAET